MNFKEAMELMLTGKKITRKEWQGSIYFKCDQLKNVIALTPNTAIFQYSETIMISGGWKIDDSEQTYFFYEIIEHLAQGKTARLVEWDDDTYIYYDYNHKNILIHKTDQFDYIPPFEAFIANDWVEV